MENPVFVRVNQQLLSANIGKNVRLVGKVKSQTGSTARIESSDGSEVVINVPGGKPYPSEFVEVLGMVQPDRTITQTDYRPFGNKFDLQLYNEMVLLANGKFRHLFAA